jgi:hypothetical protein
MLANLSIVQDVEDAPREPRRLRGGAPSARQLAQRVPILLRATLVRRHRRGQFGVERRDQQNVARLNHGHLIARLEVKAIEPARDDQRLAQLLQLARLRHAACVEDVNFCVKRGLDRSLFLRLTSSDWIRQHDVFLLVGPTEPGRAS